MIDIPVEILLYILSFLSVKEILKVSRLNRFFLNFTDDSSLWKNLYLKDFGDCGSSEDKNWKLLYMKAYLFPNIKNGFYNFNEKASEKLTEILGSKWILPNGLLDYVGLTNKIEETKISAIVRLVRNTLKNNNVKVAVYMKFISHIELLSKELSEFSPIIYTAEI